MTSPFLLGLNSRIIITQLTYQLVSSASVGGGLSFL